MLLRPPNHSLFILPLHLSDGLVLSGVELDCRGCGISYRLTSGQGHADQRGGRVALAACSACPRCGTEARFLVLVDAARRRAKVQRVSRAGLWLAQCVMRLGQRQPHPASPVNETAAASPQPQIRRAEESLGNFEGVPIPAWVEVDGRRCNFVGLLTRHSSGVPRINRDEFAIEPGLLYRAAVDDQA